MRRIALLLAALVVAAACGGSADDVGSRSRLGGKDGAQAAKGKGKPKDALARAKKVAKEAGVGGSAVAGVHKTTEEDPSVTAGVSDEIDPSLAHASASLDDPPNDATKEGITPGYAEVVHASIVGLGKDFRMTLRLNGQVPETMPNDKTHWIIAFGITGREEDEGYSFGAQCTPKGWEAYAGGKDDSSRFPGTFIIRGDEIIMTVPWTYIEGPREFNWYAASNWFAQLANTTHYSVDLVPNKDLAKFPN
ncbi:MAG: hypothetical protein ACRDI3_02385 [Actinomycetota bacterium]